MIIVHDIFVCKPGNASKVAKLCKVTMADSPGVLQILTDMTGQYHRVIIVSQYKNLAAYEKSFDQHQKDTPRNRKMNKAFAGFQEMYVSGGREIYKVW